MRDGEAWDGEFEAAARRAVLRRQQNLARGWHPDQWTDPASLLRQLDEQQSDPVEARALAHMREAERLREDRTSVSDALAWVRAHNPRNVGPDE